MRVFSVSFPHRCSHFSFSLSWIRAPYSLLPRVDFHSSLFPLQVDSRSSSSSPVDWVYSTCQIYLCHCASLPCRPDPLKSRLPLSPQWGHACCSDPVTLCTTIVSIIKPNSHQILFPYFPRSKPSSPRQPSHSSFTLPPSSIQI